MSSATKILDIAERRMRLTGYNAVSYRDIAAEIGIKSASLHYHFPKKEDLGMALVRRYTENFFTALHQKISELEAPQDKITAFVDIYHAELKERQLVCLCAVLGAEAAGLPEPVSLEVKTFFEMNITWLEEQFVQTGASDPAHDAKITLSLLEGAMVISAVNNDMSIFDAAVDAILQRPT